MNKQTAKVLAAAALIIATGVAAVETTRSTASADPMMVSGGAAGYAGARVDAALVLVSGMPEAEAFEFAPAEKGDKLPIGCIGPFEAVVQAECLDTAYEIEAEPSVVVESRFGATSILTRLDSFTVAAEY